MSNEGEDNITVVDFNTKVSKTDGAETGTKPKRGRPKKDPNEKPPRLTSGEISSALIWMLERKIADKMTPYPLNQVRQFQPDFRAMRESKKDDPMLMEVVDNTASIVAVETVAGVLSRFTNDLGGICSVFNVSIERCESAIKAWRSTQPLCKLPPPWGFKSDPELCFNRLGYDPVPINNSMDLAESAPIFSEMCTRISNPQAFLQMLGSIFFLGASRKQVLWMYGESGGGKSQVGNLLKMMLPSAYHELDNEDFDDPFFKQDLIDKRIGFLKEASPEFLRHPIFKSITGDSGHRIRRKHQGSISVQINTMFFCASNEPPNIPNEMALKNRIIPCTIAPVPKKKIIPVDELLDLWKLEIPFIVGFCMEEYKRLGRVGLQIPYDMNEHLMPIVDNWESDYLDLIEDKFAFAPGAWITNADFKRTLMDCGYYSSQDRRKILDCIKTRYKIVEDRENRVLKGSISTSRGLRGITSR